MILKWILPSIKNQKAKKPHFGYLRKNRRPLRKKIQKQWSITKIYSTQKMIQ
jgi:hypothetical protein